MSLAGLTFGVIAALMTNWGNPPNMGICIACFYRDIAGGLGLHRAAVVQYIRPEIIGFLLGAFITSFAFREWRARGGSSPLIRFVLGALFMIGALVFLGCPVRALIRLAGGDLNGITALAGVVAGAAIGVFFLKRGFNLGPSLKIPTAVGWMMPILMLGLLLLAISQPGFIFTSGEGPGSMFVPLGVSLGVGLGVGFLAQRTRMCFVGGWRDLILVRDSYLFSGVAAFFIAALITNYAVGNFAADGLYHWGFVGQPVSHDNHLWNFLGMLLAGLTATLLGGCPLRQTILSGEGNADAGITVIGFIVGAGIAHNFGLASSPSGIGEYAIWAVIIGLAFCLAVGFLMMERAK